MDCSYKVLGLEPNVSFSVVRNRYIELAKTHHPDKLSGATEAERRDKEEYFKSVTVAYHRLEQRHKNPAVSFEDIEDCHDWRSVWESLIDNSDLITAIFDVATKAAAKYKQRATTQHHQVTVPITLEEVHMSKEKKLRLFLKGVEDPIYITVNCSYKMAKDGYVMEVKEGSVIITIEFQLKDHPVYSIDQEMIDVLDELDMYANVTYTLSEYFTGVAQTLRYLDGTDVVFYIPPFCATDVPITVRGKGLCGKGDLIIRPTLLLPKPALWDKMEQDEQDKYLNLLNALY